MAGEWLLQAHGTLYDIDSDDHLFAPFDVLDSKRRNAFGDRRMTNAEFAHLLAGVPLRPPPLLHVGSALPIADAFALLGRFGRMGAVDKAEGAVWRLESEGEVVLIGKFVRHDKEDRKYLEAFTGHAIWNWDPVKL